MIDNPMVNCRLALVENSPLLSLRKAWTHGFESVSTCVVCLLSRIGSFQCSMPLAMAKAFCSHGSYLV